MDDILAEIDIGFHGGETADLEALSRAWVAERAAPELLPYPQRLVNGTIRKIAGQVEKIEEQADSADTGTNFQLVVIQTELERLKFVVRSFLRARIAKIDSHPTYYLTAPARDLLSTSEQEYLKAHQTVLNQHYSSSFLAHFPRQLQRLDDRGGGISMVEIPDVNHAVFCRALRSVRVAKLDVLDFSYDMQKGDVWVVRWSAVKESVCRGDLELI